jgi:hypothetical protein
MQPPNDPPPPDARRWVPMAEAERILGKPESTIRRWIREGRLTGEQVPRDPSNPRDTRTVWQVLVTDAPASAAPSESEQPPTPATDAPAAVAWLQDRLDERDELVREKDAEARELLARIAALEREAGAATARAASLAEQLAAERERRERAEAEADRLREQAARPWWKRVFG